MMTGSAHPTGQFAFTLRDADGTVSDEWDCTNFVTDVGRNHIADRMSDADEAAMSHMAIGSGTGQTVTSTTLATETARVALTAGYPDQGTGAELNVMIYVASFGAGVGTGTITEVGVLNASSGGTLLNYATGFTARNKGAGQTLDVTLKIAVAGAPS